MLDHTRKVTCHKNLLALRQGKPFWALSQASSGGRITAGKEYATTLTLRAVEFRVTETARQRVCRDHSREVHAWCVGIICDAPAGRTWREVTYNPFRSPYFHYRDGTPIHSAAYVHFTADGTAYAA